MTTTDDCPICMGQMTDPLTVDCGGGHRFCRSCAETWRARSQSCAVCRRVVANVEVADEAPPDAALLPGVDPHALMLRLGAILRELGLPPNALRAMADRMERVRLGQE